LWLNSELYRHFSEVTDRGEKMRDACSLCNDRVMEEAIRIGAKAVWMQEEVINQQVAGWARDT